MINTNHTLPIPTREDFHKSFAGYISSCDFYTNGCIPGSHLNRAANALHFDRTLKQQAESNRRREHESEILHLN